MEKVNMKQLAARLGVSLSTVSKALRDSYEIGEETRQRIKAVADEMGYRANPYAGHLHTNKSNTIAFIVPELNNNFFIQAICGAEIIAQEKNYHLLIYATHNSFSKEKKILGHLQNGRVDGVIMSLTGETVSYDHIINLMKFRIPVVFFDRICHEIETAKVITDDFASGFNATEHLIQSGCKQIAYLSISQNLSIDNKRLQGYKEAHLKYDMKVNDALIIRCSDDEQLNFNKINQLLLKKNRPDGVFASVEKLALTTYNVCNQLKINVPKELKVICFSNLRTAPLLNPSLTTINQPAYDMGKTAAAILFKHLNKKQTQIPNESIVIKSSLTKRNSTAYAMQAKA